MIKTSNLFQEGIQEELKREILTLIITEIEEGYNMSLEKILTWLEAKEVENRHSVQRTAILKEVKAICNELEAVAASVEPVNIQPCH